MADVLWLSVELASFFWGVGILGPAAEQQKNYHAARLNGFSIRLCHSRQWQATPQPSLPKSYQFLLRKTKKKGENKNQHKQLEFINFLCEAQQLTRNRTELSWGGVGKGAGEGSRQGAQSRQKLPNVQQKKKETILNNMPNWQLRGSPAPCSINVTLLIKLTHLLAGWLALVLLLGVPLLPPNVVACA